MSVTLNHLVYDLLNTIRAGKNSNSDDESLSKRWLEFQIETVRASLIRQDYEKSRSISDNIRQVIGCVEVEQVDPVICCNITTECKVFRTKEKIPKPIEVYQKDLITKVGSVIITDKSFQLIPYERVAWVGNTPFESLNNVPVAWYYNGYIFIKIKNNDKVIEKINIELIAESPLELKNFNNCSGKPCFDENSEYPISKHMIPTLKKIIIDNSLKLASQLPSDNKNDGNFTLEQNIEK